MVSRRLPVRTPYAFAMLAVAFAATAEATVIRFNSNLGSFDVRMFDTATPLTVANMLNYVNDGDYDNSIIHRSENQIWRQQPDGTFASDPFVIQGGNTFFNQNGLLEFIPQDAPVQNEPGISNLRGTIGLAKLSGDPNSGTTNWFFNLGDNSFLDAENAGAFTAFGRVVHDGMDVVDAISNLGTLEFSTQFNQGIGNRVPIHGDTSNGITQDNFVLFSTIEELNIPDGDFDFDGDVDGADLAILQREFGSTTELAADANGDAVVDALDLAIWEADYGIGEASLAFVGIPEPTAAALVAAAALLLGRRRF